MFFNPSWPDAGSKIHQIDPLWFKSETRCKQFSSNTEKRMYWLRSQTWSDRYPWLSSRIKDKKFQPLHDFVTKDQRFAQGELYFWRFVFFLSLVFSLRTLLLWLRILLTVSILILYLYFIIKTTSNFVVFFAISEQCNSQIITILVSKVFEN